MMGFTDIPILAQFFILVFSKAILASLIYLWIMMTMERRFGWRHVVALIYLLLLFAELIVLRWLYEKAPASEETILAVIPWFVYLILAIFFAGFSVYGNVSEYKFRRRNFSQSTIREAMENLPMGLSFSDETGHMILTNHRMYYEAETLTGKTLRNMEDFWKLLDFYHPEEDLNIRKLKEHSKEQEQATFILPDGRIMQAGREMIMVRGNKFVQTTIVDVSSLHKLYGEVEQENAALVAQRKEIRELADRLIQSNHAEEVLEHKIRVHNELGQMILSTRQLILSKGGINEYRENATKWKEIAERFGDIAGQQNADAKEMLREILEIAEQIGCEVEIAPDIPATLLEHPLIRQAIREAIVNAIRHAQASKIVLHMKPEEEYCMVIENDGQKPTTNVVFRGGLKNLNDALQAIGGKITVDTSNQFALEIHIPREEISNESSDCG